MATPAAPREITAADLERSSAENLARTKTLVQRAIALNRRGAQTAPSPERVDLALAYFDGRVNAKQAGAVLGVSHNCGQTMAAILRAAVAAGLVEVRRPGKKTTAGTETGR